MSDVTQIDREAVKAFHHAAAAHMLAAIEDGGFADALGENNEAHPIYKAFAAHRIAAEKAVLDRLDTKPMNPILDMAFDKWRVLLTGDMVREIVRAALETKR